VNQQDKTQMAEYGITSSPKRVYHYKEYRYDKLSDALSYAKSDIKLIEERRESTTPA